MTSAISTYNLARRGVRPILFAFFAWFSLDLTLRSWSGHEAYWMLAVKSPLVAESFVAVTFLLLVLSRSRREQIPESRRFQNARWEDVAVIVLLAALCLGSFAWSLSMPFVYDDYGHVSYASSTSLRTIGNMFVHSHVDSFFRPVGFFFYFLNFKWAHWDPFRWHCWNLGLHILNCILVYALSKQLGFSIFASAFAGAIFAVHGSRAEPVCWTDAQFDLLVTLFVVGALLCFGCYAKFTHLRWLVAGAGCCVLALATKEAAFSIPFLLAALLIFYKGEEQKRLARILPAVFAGTVLVFLYRWRLIGGIGGYQTGEHSNVLRFSPILTVKALAWRTWALAFFSDQLGKWHRMVASHWSAGVLNCVDSHHPQDPDPLHPGSRCNRLRGRSLLPNIVCALNRVRPRRVAGALSSFCRAVPLLGGSCRVDRRSKSVGVCDSGGAAGVQCVTAGA